MEVLVSLRKLSLKLYLQVSDFSYYLQCIFNAHGDPAGKCMFGVKALSNARGGFI